MKKRGSIFTFGEPEQMVLDQMAMCLAAEHDARAVLCGDNHPGYSMPIGGVIAYRGLISPSAVGVDIGCGNCAVRTDMNISDLAPGQLAKIMDDIWANISFGMGQKNNRLVESPIIEDIATCSFGLQRNMAQMAAQQLGTVGGGNHYVDLFADAEGFIWIGVHFGSRGFGFKTMKWAEKMAGVTDTGMMAPPILFSVDSETGQLYIDGMQRAGRYAHEGREAVVARVMEILGTRTETFRVHNHHNYAWRERHDGESFWVHRKGATPAFPGQLGFVGSTMRDVSVILSGVDSRASEAALYSTVHGAGRAHSRRWATGKTKRVKQWRCKGCSFTETKPKNIARNVNPPCPKCGGERYVYHHEDLVEIGAVDYAAVQHEVAALGIELRGGAADEAPPCYKSLPDVLREHEGTIEILCELRPIGVAMANDDDPYKD